MKPKPFSALNHFTVPSAMCWFPDCAVSVTFRVARAGRIAIPRSRTVAGARWRPGRGPAPSEPVMTELHDVAVGVPHVQSDALPAGPEELGRTPDDVEGAGVRD